MELAAKRATRLSAFLWLTNALLVAFLSRCGFVDSETAGDLPPLSAPSLWGARTVLLMLSCLLAGDAVPRPRECFQPLRFNVAAAFGTLAVGSMLDPLQRPVQILDLLLGGSSFVGEGLSLELSRRLISGVCMPCRVCTRLLHCAGKNTLCFR